MKTTEMLYEAGQSIWYDNIQRRLLQNGELVGMINRKEIFGVTSNPSIFQNAIAKSTDYDMALKPMAWAGWKAEDIFWELAIEDIRAAADLFKPLYDETDGGDGFVSLEVSPLLAHDTEGTVKQALELWKRVDRENLMIKIPATKEGVPAVEQALTAGLNVNVTLIFSLERYQEVIDAYLRGLENRIKQGQRIDHIASVASFFVSRVDSKIDSKLQKIIEAGQPEAGKAKGLLGKIAVDNSKLAYDLFKKNFTTERFTKISEAGGKLQRPLWASTSTKNPAYRDVLYVEDLIGPDTVNTVPPQTLAALLNHGKVELTVDKNVNSAKQDFTQLAEFGISIEQATLELENEGVKAFADAFESLLQTIDEKVKAAFLEVQPLATQLQSQLTELEEKKLIRRLFEVDPSLWTNNPAGQEEIRKRMNWLNTPWMNFEDLKQYSELLKYCNDEGFTYALLLGMGGSSLAPEVLNLMHGVSEHDGHKGLDLAILDSTDPIQVKAALDRSPVEKTLYIVSSKSGGTAEVNAFFNYFWEKTEEKVGRRVGDHFIAITDPGTKLETIAREKRFSRIILADPNVGGRNSALTAFGLVPAALVGMDLSKLIQNSLIVANQSVPEVKLGANPGAVLGAVIGSAWKQGRDKLTILTDELWSPFGSWLEQLIAESSGKNGKGIIPIAQEPLMDPSLYKNDRLFVYLCSDGGKSDFCTVLRRVGQPVFEFDVNDAYDLGSQFYLWEVATAIACSILQVNSFDQPDVQDNKNRTTIKIEDYVKTGSLQELSPSHVVGKTKIFSTHAFQCSGSRNLNEVIMCFLEKMVKPNDYIAINAYLPRNVETEQNLTALRKQILQKFGNATTLGFGPRFLHSTGQLHKGGPNEGVFIQISAETGSDIKIPGSPFSFGILERAQAIGDYEALEARGRRVMRLHLEKSDSSLLLGTSK